MTGGRSLRPRRRRRTVSALAAAMAVAAGLSGCLPSPGKSTQGNDSLHDDRAWMTAATAVWQSEEELLSEIAVIAGAAIAYVHTGRGAVGIVARDLHTGEELWRDDAVAGSDSPDELHEVPALTIGGRPVVSYLSRTGSDLMTGRLVVADARSGEPVATEKAEIERSVRPVRCGDTFCASSVPLESGLRMHRYDADAGAFVPVGEQAPAEANSPYASRVIGRHLFVTNPRYEYEDILHFASDGVVRWSLNVQEIFGQGRSVTHWGDWNDADEDAPVVGTAAQIWDVPLLSSNTVTFDMTAAGIAGLDRETGSVLWKHEGIGSCSAANGMTVRDDLVIACRFNSGTREVQLKEDEVLSDRYLDLSIDLVALDRATGEIRWELPMGSDDANAGEGGSAETMPAIEHRAMPLAVIDGAPQLVDPLSGHPRPLPEGASLLCAEGSVRDNRVRLMSSWGQGEMWPYAAVPGKVACGPDRSVLADATPSMAALALAGYKTGFPLAVPGRDGMVAYAAPE